jgi:hypothetical protein
MSEIHHGARVHGSLALMIGRRQSPWPPIEPSRDAHAWPDTMATDWRRLRAIVDGLLHRAAASKDAATAIDATRNRAGAATNTTPKTQEATHG